MAAPAATATPRPDALKRVYTGITLTRDDLGRVFEAFRDSTRDTVMKANTFQLHDLEELDAVVSEDQVIDCLSITGSDPRSGRMHLSFDFGYVLLEANDPSWSGGFAKISRLLDAIPKNGTTRCAVSMRRSAVHRLSSRTAAAVAAAVPTSSAPAAVPAGDTPAGPVPVVKAIPEPTPLAVAAQAAATAAPAPAPMPAAPIAVGGRFQAAPAAVPASRHRVLTPIRLWMATDACLLVALAHNWTRLVHGMDSMTAWVLVVAGVCALAASIWTTLRPPPAAASPPC